MRINTWTEWLPNNGNPKLESDGTFQPCTGKKNKTLKWLSNLSEQDQLAVVDLAVKKRQQVHKEYQDEEKLRSEQRKQIMAQENARREH